MLRLVSSAAIRRWAVPVNHKSQLIIGAHAELTLTPDAQWRFDSWALIEAQRLDRQRRLSLAFYQGSVNPFSKNIKSFLPLSRCYPLIHARFFFFSLNTFPRIWDVALNENGVTHPLASKIKRMVKKYIYIFPWNILLICKRLDLDFDCIVKNGHKSLSFY